MAQFKNGISDKSQHSMWNRKLMVGGFVALLGCLIALAFGRIDFTRRIDAAAFDLDRHRIFPLRSIEGKAVVLIFLSVDCPISIRYAPEIQRLDAKFSREGVKFWLVYPNADETTEVVRKHTQEYGYHVGVLRDPKRALVKISRAQVTPEAAVFLPNGKLIYHGGLDDRYVDFGVERQQAVRHNLEEILTVVAEGKQIKASTAKAVGCPISDLR
jgi:hypothetical protein